MSNLRKALLSLACTSLLVPSLASAHGYGRYVTPAATPPIVFAGPVTVGKKLFPTSEDYAVILNCDIEVRIKGPEEAGDGVAVSHTDEDHLKARITFTGGDDGCIALTVNKIYDIELDDVTQSIKFNNVYVNTNLVPGDANGDIVGNLTPGNGLDIPLTILGPGNPLTGDAFVVSVSPLTRTSPDAISFHADDHL